VTGDWINVHNDRLHELYSSPTIMVIKSKRTIWVRHAVRMGEKGMHRGFWVAKTGRKRPLGRTVCSREDNIVMDV
jgi:hypothetical protein